MSLTAPHFRREWTKEEEEKLDYFYGKKPIKQIAKMLNRKNIPGIRTKISRMGLSASYKHQGHLTLSEFADLLEVSDYKIRRWIKDKNMPSKEVVTALKKKYTLIEVSEFWKWAEVNKEEVNFYKIKPYTLLPEPPWVNEAREKDKREIPLRRNKFFTSEEDQQLLHLYFKENLTQKAIASAMNRSRDSIRNRLARLRKQ